MGHQNRTTDQVIADLASGAKGLVRRRALREAGVSLKAIRTRLENGSLITEYPGVYRVGHRAPCVEARYTAAIKACGDGAILKGRAAAYLLGILKSPTPPPPEVLTARDRRVKGVKTTRTRRIDRQDATTHKGIPCTTVPRTLVDLAAVLDEDALARACHEAGVKYRITPRHVEAVLERRPNSPGAPKLRAIISGDVKVSLSALEKRFNQRLQDADLPLPETNRPVGSHRVDCRWPKQRVTVELDGFRFHNSRHSWENDRRREREAHARKDAYRRYTYADVFEDPTAMLAELRDLLT
jgi:very-short-patch-repair endonuclease